MRAEADKHLAGIRNDYYAVCVKAICGRAEADAELFAEAVKNGDIEKPDGDAFTLEEAMYAVARRRVKHWECTSIWPVAAGTHTSIIKRGRGVFEGARPDFLAYFGTWLLRFAWGADALGHADVAVGSQGLDRSAIASCVAELLWRTRPGRQVKKTERQRRRQT